MKKVRYMVGTIAAITALVATGAAIAHGVVVIKGTMPCAIAAPVATRAVRAAIVPTTYLTFFI